MESRLVTGEQVSSAQLLPRLQRYTGHASILGSKKPPVPLGTAALDPSSLLGGGGRGLLPYACRFCLRGVLAAGWDSVEGGRQEAGEYNTPKSSHAPGSGCSCLH